MKLNKEDFQLILESLKYSKLNYDNDKYPSYEFKQEKIKQIEDLILKINEIAKTNKDNS